MMPLTSSLQCEEYLRNIWEKNTLQTQERVYAVFLNQKGERIFHALLNKGCYADTVFDLRELMQYAFSVHSDYIVIAHNHPNGNPEPSERDKEATKRIEDTLAAIDIALIDHIILTHDKYFSFKDSGLLCRVPALLLGLAFFL